MLVPDRVWAVVPVKLLSTAKSRLAPVMALEERVALCLSMLDHVLDALEAAATIGHHVIVSPDPRVLAIARRKGILAVQDQGLGLNDALNNGVAMAMALGADAALMLPADLPRLRSDELDQLIECAGESRCVVLAPAASDGGTNALLVRPPDVLRPDFGVNSFQIHCRRARESGIACHVFDAPGLAFDVDTPEALAALGSPEP